MTGTGPYLSISVDGESVEIGALWAKADGAREALERLRGDLGRFGQALSPGDLGLAGTSLGLQPVREDDRVVVSIDGRAFVECRFK